MFSILKKEVSSYFNSLIGYIAISLFLLLSGLIVWVFPDSSVLDSGYANLEGFFSLAPYLFIFLAPAITMRSIAGEKMDGTYDLLLSRPISISKIVFGKFIGALVIIILAILPTIIYAFSIYAIANPVGTIDIGALIGSYIGLLFLAIAFVAIGIFSSAITRNAIVAFLLGAFFCFLFYYCFEAISQLTFLANVEDLIKGLGIQEHYFSISRGVLIASDLFYFIAIAGIFIIFSILFLNRKFSTKKQTYSIAFGTLIIATLINSAFVTNLWGRIDFTEDKRFTLNPNSIQILENLKGDIYLNIFLDGELPSGFNRLKKAAIDLAMDLKSYSKGKVHFNVINPNEGNQEEQQKFTQALIERGLFPTNLNVKSESGFTQKLIFPSAIVGDTTQEINVNLLQNRIGLAPEQVLNNSIQNLEYAFVSAIDRINKKQNGFIGFTEGHGEPNDLELYDAMHSITDGNQVGRVNLDSMTFDGLGKLNVLIIVKPKQNFSEADKYKIDYFVRNGGKIIWAIDQIDMSMDHLRKGGEQPLVGRTLNLDDQLFLYGARLNYNLIADMNCAQIPITVGNIGNQSRIELAPWLFAPILMPQGTNPIIKNLDGIRTEFIGSIDTIESPSIKKEILLTSSPFTRLINTPSNISLQMIEQQPDPKTFKSKPEAVAVLLEGKFPYLYENRQAPEGIQEIQDLKNISKKAKMFVVSDGDWLVNQINQKDQSPFPLGWDRYMNQQFGNKTLFQNMISYLLNDSSLIALRNREVKLTMLNQAELKDKKLFWQIINVALPIFILLIGAVLQQFLRKRKYAN